MARLAVLEASHSGFAIAEADLAARGAGDVIGRRQSGRDAAGALRVARLPDDRDLLEAARRGAACALGRYGADPAAWPPALLAALRSQARPLGGLASCDAHVHAHAGAGLPHGVCCTARSLRGAALRCARALPVHDQCPRCWPQRAARSAPLLCPAAPRSGACSRVRRGAEGCSAAGQAIPALDLHALPVNALRAQAAAAALAAGASGA